MAESDAAGPAPSDRPPSPQKAPRRTTLAQVAREMERRSAPLRQAAAEAEKFHRQIESFTATGRRLRAEFGIEEGEGGGDAAPPLPPSPTPPVAQSPGPEPRPPFEIEPPQDLLVALRHAYPGFEPVDGWWFHVEKDLKDRHHRSNPSGHGAFCTAYSEWTAVDLLAHLADVGLIPKPRKPRGKTVCERLRDLHAEDPDFTETASVRKLAKRIGRAPATLDESHYYQTKLKPRRAEVAAQKKAVKRAQRWGDFDSVGRRDTARPNESGPEDH